VIDYYASDLADMAVYLVNSWLMLQDGRVSDRKRVLARMYIGEHIPQVQRSRQAILTAGKLSEETRASLLTIA
jgi:hypothetical protein